MSITPLEIATEWNRNLKEANGLIRKKDLFKLFSKMLYTMFVLSLFVTIFHFVLFINDNRVFSEYGIDDFEQISFEELKDGRAVNGEITVIIEEIAVYKNNSLDNIYYLIPVYKQISHDEYIADYIIALSFTDYHNRQKMLDILSDTWDAQAGIESYLFSNYRIQMLPKKVQGYITEWYETEKFYDGGTFIDWSVETNFFGSNDTEYIKSRITSYEIERIDAYLTVMIVTGAITMVWLFVIVAIKKLKSKLPEKAPFEPILISSAYKKYAKEIGFTLYNGVAYGRIKEFMVTLLEGNGFKQINICVKYKNEYSQYSIRDYIDTAMKNKKHKIRRYDVEDNLITIEFKDSPNTMKMIKDFIKEFFNFFCPNIRQAIFVLSVSRQLRWRILP